MEEEKGVGGKPSATNPETPVPQPKMLGGITGKGFMPGVSGNPSGIGKHDLARELCRKIWQEAPAEIRKGILAQLRKGNPKMVLVSADRAFGRVPHNVSVDLQANLYTMSDEELRAKVNQLRAQEAGGDPSESGPAENPEASEGSE